MTVDQIEDDDDRAIPDAIEEVFIRLQKENGLLWREAAHALIDYGVDALHINPGAEGTEGELIAARATVEDALAELRAEPPSHVRH